MDEWVGIWNDNRDLTDFPDPAVPEPASEEQIEAYEDEVGVALPEELKDLFRYSDGLNAGWIFVGQMAHCYHIRTNSLRPPTDNRPSWLDILEDLEPYNPHALSSLINIFGDFNRIWMSLASGCEGKLFYFFRDSQEGHGWAAESLTEFIQTHIDYHNNDWLDWSHRSPDAKRPRPGPYFGHLVPLAHLNDEQYGHWRW